MHDDSCGRYVTCEHLYLRLEALVSNNAVDRTYGRNVRLTAHLLVQQPATRGVTCYSDVLSQACMCANEVCKNHIQYICFAFVARGF